MIKFLSLSSGSNGNCYYIGNERVALLIDLGIGGRTIKKRLGAFEIDVNSVQMVLVTHDHTDHIKYLGGFTEHFKKPVFATEVLHRVLENHIWTRGHMCGCIKNTVPGVENEWGGVKFTSFRVPHDAHDTVGYFIDFFGETFTFITDAGAVTNEAVEYCRKAKHLIIEANYDTDMLMGGSYAEELKQRISNGYGHLANGETAMLIYQSWHPELKSIFLCHLSENNNTPELAVQAAKNGLAKALKDNNADMTLLEQITLYPLPRRQSSQLFLYQEESDLV